MRARLVASDRIANRIDRRLGRAVQIGDPGNLQGSRNLVPELDREGLAAQRQMAERHPLGPLNQHGLQIGRHAADERHGGLVDLPPEGGGRFPRRIADHDRGAATHERQQGLLDCGIERAGDEQRSPELPVDVRIRWPSASILLARLACVTTTPFGVPVEPEV